MDDGCYLPLSFVKDTGRPKQAASLYFAIADAALSALCEEKSWEYVGDHEHCCRVALNKRLHIDVPLYAIDDVRFVTLKEARAKVVEFSELARMEDTETLDWARMSGKDVLHATRSDGWQYSDPIAVRDWANAAVGNTDEQLRSVWRYMKTWRDLHFPRGGPPSILIMGITEGGFGMVTDWDDIKLRDVAEYFSDAILNDFYPEWDDTENLNRLPKAERQIASAKAKELVAALNVAFAATDSSKAETLTTLKATLSAHLPDRPDAIEGVGPYAAALAFEPTRTESARWAPNTQSG